MLICENLILKSDVITILNNISFTLFPGSITFIKGSNGSGKTSLLRILAGITEQTSGNIFYNAILLSKLEKPYSQYIGHHYAIKHNITVGEQLQCFASLYQCNEAISATMKYLELDKYQNDLCSNLSQGNMKKLLLARLLMSKSDLWLIDEIDSNLDDKNRILMQNIITIKANNGGIIICATHNEPFIQNPQIIYLDDFKC